MATNADASAATSALPVRAPRMYFQDLKTLEIMEAQFNPAKLEEVLAVDWNRLVSPGNSHRRLQYNYTDNHKVTLELIFDALQAGDTKQLVDGRKFLLSLAYAKRGAQSVREGEATRFLFVWPEMFSMTCVIASASLSHTSFNRAGVTTYMTVKLTLEEIRDTRLYSEDVRNDGTRRSSAGDQTK